MSAIAKSEFTAADAYAYDRRSVTRWVISHVWRYRGRVLLALLFYIISSFSYSAGPVLIGRAVDTILTGQDLAQLSLIALAVLGVLVLDGLTNLSGAWTFEFLAKRFSADARQELYAALLGKSQTFHNRQRVGDLMARATDDVSLLSEMLTPGASLILETVMSIIAPLAFIALINPQLLLVPVLFLVAYAFAVRAYTRELEPVTDLQRVQFGDLNAKLEETISGIEVVKASAQERAERAKFQTLASQIRGSFLKQGWIEARYLPLLLFAIAVGLQFLHALYLRNQGVIDLASVIAVMGLMNVLRWPTFASIFTFSLVQAGLSSSGRILAVIKGETELDQNRGGHSAPIKGEITFDHVSFGHEDRPLLHDVSFTVAPGQTVAIVGQTGSGKSSLTQLVNRTYDASAGRVLIDGVDVREWSLESLRSQIGKIEQDIFLFSRTVAENIAFGRPGASLAEIEAAAKAAQAHGFILQMKDGYNTVVGERGVTLSGGQRQRIALARAFLNDPRVLILDDSTSAIDSATEDEIQKAIRQVQNGRTTLLITHRLSQIRWADTILVLDGGRLSACGSHEELLKTSPLYRRIFARFESRPHDHGVAPAPDGPPVAAGATGA